MGLLSGIMKSPELMAALGLGGAGYMLADDEDKLGNGVAGAALGLAAGRGIRGMRGLLSRVPDKAIVLSDADKIARVKQLRQMMGQTGSQVTQMPPRELMDAIREVGMSEAMLQHGDRIGMNGIDKAIEGVDETARLGGHVINKIWDGVDSIAERAMPKDRLAELENMTSRNGRWILPTLVGGGIIGGLGGTGYMLAQSQGNEKDDSEQAFIEKAMQSVGMENTPTGIKMFQAQAGIPLTGELDDETITALAQILSSQRSAQDEGPPAPSLAPHNRR